MLSLENHFIGTYGKNALQNWSVIAKFIQQHGTWIREMISKSEQTESHPEDILLTDQKINDALNGPLQNFFKTHLFAYATIAKLETAATLTKEDYFKETEHTEELNLGLPNYLIERNDFSTLKNLREQLSAMTKEHHAQWAEKEKEWEAIIIAELKVIDILISDSELQDLTMHQPISELNDRFINLKLTPPALPKDPFNFQQYWMLKSAIAIQSVFGRLQQPITDKEINDKVKLLKTAFKKIADTEKELIDTQRNAIQKLLTPITPSGKK